jgi:hypothetical protein
VIQACRPECIVSHVSAKLDLQDVNCVMFMDVVNNCIMATQHPFGYNFTFENYVSFMDGIGMTYNITLCIILLFLLYWCTLIFPVNSTDVLNYCIFLSHIS